jgi:MotA/TolQ/ExbB proton channel family
VSRARQLPLLFFGSFGLAVVARARQLPLLSFGSFGLAVVITAMLYVFGLLLRIPFGIGDRLEKAPLGVLLVLLVVLAVFFTLMFRIVFRIKGIRIEQRIVRQASQKMEGLRSGNPGSAELRALVDELSDKPPESLVADRFALLKDRMRDTDRSAFLLSSRSGLDEASTGNAATMDHALTWALPVLGFLGTAFAMARTVEGFSQALDSAANFQLLKKNLLDTVIPHLSQAFDVTLVALTLAIVAFLSLSALERTQRALIIAADEAALLLIAKLPGSRPVKGSKDPSDLQQLSTSMDHASDAIEQLRMATLQLTEAQSRPRRITFIEDRSGPP